MPLPKYTEYELEGIIGEVINFAEEQREYLFRASVPLSARHLRVFDPFFPAHILQKTRIVTGDSVVITDPAFAERARERGFTMVPNFAHLSEIAFQDVLLLQAQPTDRLLFHALVHAVQYDVLGLERYIECYVRAFARTGLHVNVPLEVHAFELDARFARGLGKAFSVEAEVRKADAEGRY